jgi:hypothetical protein
MANDAISDRVKAHQTGQEKYTYFLLAAAGAAIGFAVQKTVDLALSWGQLPVGLACLSWARSFYCGCRTLEWVQACLAANKAMIELSRGTHASQPGRPQVMEAAMQGVMTALDGNRSKALWHGGRQFQLLILGALLFIG